MPSAPTLTVPVDYADPEGRTIEISVLKVPAKKCLPAHRLARGQPGRARRLRGRLRPRGRLHRRARRCATGTTSSASTRAGSGARRRSTASPTPSSTASSAPTPHRTTRPRSGPSRRARRTSRAPARTNAGALLPHVSTEDAARDMDVLRAALGEEKLHLPRQVLRHLPRGDLCRPVPAAGRPVRPRRRRGPRPHRPQEINLGQAKGFELATRAWAKYCVDEGNCPLGDSVDVVMENLRGFLARRRRQPPAAHRGRLGAAAHRGMGLARHRGRDVRPGRLAHASSTRCATRWPATAPP